MRRALTVVLLVVVGCSSATGDTTSTVGQAAAPTTTATAEPTTSSTLGPAECPPEGGGQTARGFYCPPELPVVGASGVTAPSQFFPSVMPGRYVTRVFDPAFEFVIVDRPTVAVEEQSLVQLYAVGGQFLLLTGSVMTATFDWDQVADTECFNPSRPSSQTMFGQSVQVFEITNECEDNSQAILMQPTLFVPAGWSARFYLFASPDGTELLVMIAALTSNLDTFIEATQPIIDSIRFLDQ